MKPIKVYKHSNTKNTPLNDLRFEKNLTLTEIAKHMGISVGSVATMFNKTITPTKENLNKLTTIFDMSYEQLCKRLGIDPEYPKDTTKGIPHNNTYWNKVRNEAGLSYVEVAEGIGKKGKHKTIAKYFTGELIPTNVTISAICNLFDVDFYAGKEEFRKAHAVWVADHRAKEDTSKEQIAITIPSELEVNGRVMTRKEIIPEVSAPETPVSETPVSETSTTEKPDIGRLLYNKVDYDEFNTIMGYLNKNTETDSVLEAIYGKVDCTTYNTVYDAFKNS